jgi:cellulose synthase/poly-beta-1,6-N-acetylglucosamine synthase-like glycosyltransferase
MIFAGIFVLGFTAIRLAVVLVNLLTRQWLQPGNLSQTSLVSILIPARNEEKNIGQLLDYLLQHDYPNLEIWVYDDLSTDRTWNIIDFYAKNHSSIKAIKGKILPQGWLGKNNACHQLALKAEGEYLLFMDADVKPDKGLITNALAHLNKYNLDLLSIFPVQKMISFTEKITVPLMNWILVSLLPLILTRISQNSSFAAANGQFMLFRKDVYIREKFHQLFKKQKVEDIHIFRSMKRKGYRTHTLLGNRQISCRMYHSWSEAVNGFSKNVFDFFGGSKLLAFLFAMITTFGFLPVVWAMHLNYIFIYLLLVAGLRGVVSYISRQNILQNILLAPVQQIVFLYVVMHAFILQQKKLTTWKGRNIDQL